MSSLSGWQPQSARPVPLRGAGEPEGAVPAQPVPDAAAGDELARLAAENAELEKMVESLTYLNEHSHKEAEAERARREAEAAAGRGRVQELDRRLAEAEEGRRRVPGLEKRLSEADAAIANLRDSLERANKEGSEKASLLFSAREETRKRQESELNEAATMLEAAGRREAELRKSVEDARTGAARAAAELGDARRELEAEKARLAELEKASATVTGPDPAADPGGTHSGEAATPEHDGHWRLKTADGSVYGPVGWPDLYQWILNCRIAPGDRLSRDGTRWTTAVDVPELRMDWMIDPPAGAPVGPLNLMAFFRLVDDGDILPSAVLRNRNTGASGSIADACRRELADMHVMLSALKGDVDRIGGVLEAIQLEQFSAPAPASEEPTALHAVEPPEEDTGTAEQLPPKSVRRNVRTILENDM